MLSKADVCFPSDTTGPSLILLWYLLARYPEHAAKIRQEIHAVDHEDPAALSALPHLNGVINESMRLLPAALTAGTRITPPEGLCIEGTLIPGGTKIAAPRYSIFRRKPSNNSSPRFSFPISSRENKSLIIPCYN